MLPPTALPKYIEVSERLAREVEAGRLREGEKLPPERDMAEGLGIAVGTLRKALDQLVEQGLVERVHGSGNYIKKPPQMSNIYAFFRLENLSGGGYPTAQVLDVSLLDKPTDMPAFGTSDKAHRIRRLRLLDDQPAALEEIWLDAAVVETVTTSDLSDSLYLFYRQRLGLTITRIEDRARIASAPIWGRSDLVLPNTINLIERRSWAADPHPIEFSRSYLHPDRAVYVARS